MACAFALGSAIVAAHPTQFTTLQVAIDPSGVYRGTLNIDILSYALGQTSQDTSNEQLQALLDAPRMVLARDLAEAGQRFQRELVVRTNVGDMAPSAWSLPGLPEVNAVLARHLQPPILMPGEIDFSGRLPAGARTVAFRLPYIMGDTVQVYELPNGDSHDEPVEAGGISSAVGLGMTVPAWSVPEHAGFVPGIEVLGGILGVLLVAGWWWRVSRRKQGRE